MEDGEAESITDMDKDRAREGSKNAGSDLAEAIIAVAATRTPCFSPG